VNTLEETSLEHYGIKGMRWGVRKASDPSSSAEIASKTKKTKPSTNDILTARSRQQARQRAYQEAQAEFIVARTRKGKDQAEKTMRRMEKEYFTNPDAETAKKLTKGEKWFTGAAWTSLALMSAGLVLAAAEST